MLDRIVVAKLEWADYHQGEGLNRTFSGGDQYERYNFRRAADGFFYGVIPGNKQPKDRAEKWTVMFVARHPSVGKLMVVGWYEDAVFVDKQVRPEYAWDSSMPESSVYRTPLKYTIRAPRAVYLPAPERIRYPLPDVGKRFRSFIYVRAPEVASEPWRRQLARFVENLINRQI